MSLQLTFWEYDELLEHLVDREDIWIQSDENPFLWLRVQTLYDAEGAASTMSGLALSFLPPASSDSPYRVYTLDVHVMDWEEEYVLTYVARLLEHWTIYGSRQRVETFLTNELGVPPDVAVLGAIGITAFDHEEDRSDPDSTEGPPQQATLWPDCLPPLTLPALRDPLDVGTWLLQGGGYVKLRLQGGMIAVSISIRDPIGDGYGPPLQGFVRPPDGRLSDYVHSIRGEVQSDEETTNRPEPELLEGFDELQTPVRVEAGGGPGSGGEAQRPGDRDGDA